MRDMNCDGRAQVGQEGEQVRRSRWREASAWQRVSQGWELRKGTGVLGDPSHRAVAALQGQLGAVEGEAARQRDGEGKMQPWKA